MNLDNLVKELNLKLWAGTVDGRGVVTSGYASDLMSDVLAKAKQGSVWVTNQKHVNVVAVASLLGLAGVIIAGGLDPDENTIEKANEENVALFTTSLPTFEVVGRLYGLGIRGDVG